MSRRANSDPRWCGRCIFEDGSRRDGVISTAECREIWRGEVEGSWITRRRFELPLDLPPGYHEFEARIAGGAAERCLADRLAAALLSSLPRFSRAGGCGALPCSCTRCARGDNWGIGDFNDLQMLIRWVASRGAGFIGLNPLHALAPADPGRSSPYSASSRHFLNVLYIAVPLVPEFEECAAASERLAAPQVARRLRELRAPRTGRLPRRGGAQI